MPQDSTAPEVTRFDAYDAARRRAAWIDRTGARGRILVSGQDRASYLQGLLTNDIVALKPGEGCYSAYLTPQGRMITDLFVCELGDVILLIVPRAMNDPVLAKLDQFIFSEDVKLGDVSDAFAEFGVVGPAAASLVEHILGGGSADALSTLPEHGSWRGSFGGEPAVVISTRDAGEPGFSVLVDAVQADAFRKALVDAGCPGLDVQSAEAIRIEGGVPLFGRDMDEHTIPLEAGIESRAISLTKGCYVGQEVIIRVLHRGHGRVARRLVGLTLSAEAAVPAAGATVASGEREVGHVTSAARSPGLGVPIALAYVQRDFAEPGTPLTVNSLPTRVAALPFVQSGG